MRHFDLSYPAPIKVKAISSDSDETLGLIPPYFFEERDYSTIVDIPSHFFEENDDDAGGFNSQNEAVTNFTVTGINDFHKLNQVPMVGDCFFPHSADTRALFDPGKVEIIASYCSGEKSILMLNSSLGYLMDFPSTPSIGFLFDSAAEIFDKRNMFAKILERVKKKCNGDVIFVCVCFFFDRGREFQISSRSSYFGVYDLVSWYFYYACVKEVEIERSNKRCVKMAGRGAMREAKMRWVFNQLMLIQTGGSGNDTKLLVKTSARNINWLFWWTWLVRIGKTHQVFAKMLLKKDVLWTKFMTHFMNIQRFGMIAGSTSDDVGWSLNNGGAGCHRLLNEVFMLANEVSTHVTEYTFNLITGGICNFHLDYTRSIFDRGKSFAGSIFMDHYSEVIVYDLILIHEYPFCCVQILTSGYNQVVVVAVMGGHFYPLRISFLHFLLTSKVCGSLRNQAVTMTVLHYWKFFLDSSCYTHLWGWKGSEEDILLSTAAKVFYKDSGNSTIFPQMMSWCLPRRAAIYKQPGKHELASTQDAQLECLMVDISEVLEFLHVNSGFGAKSYIHCPLLGAQRIQVYMKWKCSWLFLKLGCGKFFIIPGVLDVGSLTVPITLRKELNQNLKLQLLVVPVRIYNSVTTNGNELAVLQVDITTIQRSSSSLILARNGDSANQQWDLLSKGYSWAEFLLTEVDVQGMCVGFVVSGSKGDTAMKFLVIPACVLPPNKDREQSLAILARDGDTPLMQIHPTGTHYSHGWAVQFEDTGHVHPGVVVTDTSATEFSVNHGEVKKYGKLTSALAGFFGKAHFFPILEDKDNFEGWVMSCT